MATAVIDRPVAEAHGHHVPVLAAAVLETLAPVEAGTYVDLTLGLGGHAALLLDANPELTLVGIDRDRDALAVASERLARFGDRVQLHHARSDELASGLDHRASMDW